MARLKNSTRYRMMLSWLKRKWPPSRPVSVRCLEIPKLHYRESADLANCELIRGKFLIQIEKRQCLELRMEALIHEWAHAMTWFGAETLAVDHGAEWGISYAKVYRSFLEWNFGRGVDEEVR